MSILSEIQEKHALEERQWAQNFRQRADEASAHFEQQIQQEKERIATSAGMTLIQYDQLISDEGIRAASFVVDYLRSGIAMGHEPDITAALKAYEQQCPESGPVRKDIGL